MNGDGYGSGCFIALFLFCSFCYECAVSILYRIIAVPHQLGSHWRKRQLKVAVERCLLFGARILVSEWKAWSSFIKVP